MTATRVGARTADAPWKVGCGPGNETERNVRGRKIEALRDEDDGGQEVIASETLSICLIHGARASAKLVTCSFSTSFHCKSALSLPLLAFSPNILPTSSLSSRCSQDCYSESSRTLYLWPLCLYTPAISFEDGSLSRRFNFSPHFFSRNRRRSPCPLHCPRFSQSPTF